MELTALSWNLFHGRDFPPDRDLFTWRSRLLRRSERGATHVQVNRELLPEFARLLAAAEWDVALLQECPPHWWQPLAVACEAAPHGVLTSRNSFGALRARAARLNPDLIASAEGGSNLTLVRRAFRNGEAAVERREMTIHAGRPERRAMAFTRVVGGDDPRRGDARLCVANLHASAHDPALAAADVLQAAEAASAWAGEQPLIFGGDLNLRPRQSPAVFDELREGFALAAPTGPSAIDHLLARGLDAVAAPSPWPPERRELDEGGLALRLSDHSPVQAKFATRRTR